MMKTQTKEKNIKNKGSFRCERAPARTVNAQHVRGKRPLLRELRGKRQGEEIFDIRILKS